MTFSLLVHDRQSGTFGGAAATGSLCVGGWVLRGDAASGLSASQGTAPSTLWGTEALERMKTGETAEQAVAAVTGRDPGRDHRQLAALDRTGGTGSFTGAQNIPHAGSVARENVVAAGNMLTSDAVLPACLDAFEACTGDLPRRLLAALFAAQTAGGDNRGLLSAALLVVSRDAAPLSLRIDHASDPLASLADLYETSQGEPYRTWTTVVPTLNDPYAPGAEDRVAGATGVPVRRFGSEP